MYGMRKVDPEASKPTTIRKIKWYERDWMLELGKLLAPHRVPRGQRSAAEMFLVFCWFNLMILVVLFIWGT